jgi:two-component sensor histidine kinase
VTLGANGDPRISYSGPAMILDPQTAVKLALFLHELGTYARKHGALSVPEGRLSASWEVRMNGVDEFCLKWVESGGPKVSHPSEPGFGTTLIEQSLLACGGKSRSTMRNRACAARSRCLSRSRFVLTIPTARSRPPPRPSRAFPTRRL